jgi:hypothetical protein
MISKVIIIGWSLFCIYSLFSGLHTSHSVLLCSRLSCTAPFFVYPYQSVDVAGEDRGA